MSTSTPNKQFSLKAAIYMLFDSVDQENNYKCKSCANLISGFGSTTSNLRKHINSTNPIKHASARITLADLDKESPYAVRTMKRKQIQIDSLKTPNKDLVLMGACTPKKKFKYNNPRQIEWYRNYYLFNCCYFFCLFFCLFLLYHKY